jgi:magnesium transporter
MVKNYEIVNNVICPSDSETAAIKVYITPTRDEMNGLIQLYNVDEHTLQSTLDPDEVARVEFEPDQLALVFKRPCSFSYQDKFLFKVSSFGIFQLKEHVIVVLSEDIPLFDAKQYTRVTCLKEVMLRLIYRCIYHFLGHLKVINQISDELEDKINASMENKHLIHMFTLEKSLVYYLNAIQSNNASIEKLKLNAAKIGYSLEQIEYLDDLLIENQQCYKQAEIYSNVLTGLMDARGSVVNNNLSILIKRLTIINIVFMPLNLLAGIGGMSEFSMMTQKFDWRIAYSLFLLAMGVIGLLTYLLMERISREKKSVR